MFSRYLDSAFFQSAGSADGVRQATNSIADSITGTSREHALDPGDGLHEHYRETARSRTWSSPAMPSLLVQPLLALSKLQLPDGGSNFVYAGGAAGGLLLLLFVV